MPASVDPAGAPTELGMGRAHVVGRLLGLGPVLWGYTRHFVQACFQRECQPSLRQAKGKRPAGKVSRQRTILCDQ